uniref:Secernin 3 n=1 Tax=Anas zonorhyncha TaxID=75864 RepID=A0A8B9TZP3_9AVES
MTGQFMPQETFIRKREDQNQRESLLNFQSPPAFSRQPAFTLLISWGRELEWSCPTPLCSSEPRGQPRPRRPPAPCPRPPPLTPHLLDVGLGGGVEILLAHEVGERLPHGCGCETGAAGCPHRAGCGPSGAGGPSSSSSSSSLTALRPAPAAEAAPWPPGRLPAPATRSWRCRPPRPGAGWCSARTRTGRGTRCRRCCTAPPHSTRPAPRCRLGLERADTAEKALTVIVDLLEKYGQGGNCMESHMAFTYHNSFLIADRKEAWVLETSGKYWAAEKVEGSITSETMMEILRDKESGINMEGGFMTTGSMVSVLPQEPNLPCIHFFTGTPDPARSVFKPFIFVPNVTQLLKTTSPTFGHDDPVKKQPRFQSKPDRRHELYKKHESAAVAMEAMKDEGKEMLQKIQMLEKSKINEMESILQNGCLDTNQVVNLFSQCVEEELKIYSS